MNRLIPMMVAVVILGLGSCGRPGQSNGKTDLQLDGRTLSVTSTCVNSAAQQCTQRSSSVTCNVPGPLGDREIIVSLKLPEQIAVGADRVTWYQGRDTSLSWYRTSSQPTRQPGVWNFQPSQGAYIDVMLGEHHLTGKLRCD